MRVLQLGPYPPPHGGVQANLSAIRDALRERGIQSLVITLTRSRKAATDDADVHRPQSALEMLWHLLRLRYDIVHLHIGGNLTTRLLGLTFVCALMPGARSVLTFHSGGYPSSPAGRTARRRSLRGFVFRRLDRIICVNSEIVEMFKKFGVREDRIRLIYPYAVAPASKETEMPEALRSFLESHEPVLISVGLLEPEYNLPMQIEVLGRVRERFPRAGLIMIGSGSIEAELRQLISSRPYADDLMLCGDVEHAVTVGVIAQSDLMLRTTVYDGDSISVREALHLGTPVIATDNGMRPEGVDLIPTASLDALLAAIEKRLTNAAPRAPQARDGMENIEAVLELYQELMTGRASRGALDKATE
ncbi:MAG: glycosyltransferase family 4 protein, partial [Acidobacteria bacterium]|nr:glycosyltransferase family 4 protein [Acidobacteriota bacterium]